LSGLLRCFMRDGGRAVQAHVSVVEGDARPAVATQAGCRVEGSAVVVVTNTPINDRFVIHAKQAPYRSYVIASRVIKGTVPDALCWDTADPYHYTRLQP